MAKFVFVGGLNTLVGYSIFAGLLFFNIHYVIASVAGHLTGMVNSYFWNKFFTFKTPGKSLREVRRLIVVYSINYAVALGGLILFVEIFNLHPLVGQAIVLIFTTLGSFFGHKYWTFSSHNKNLEPVVNNE